MKKLRILLILMLITSFQDNMIGQILKSKIMNKENLISQLQRTDKHIFETKLFSKFFGRECKLIIFSGNSSKEKIVVSDHLFKCIQDFQELDLKKIDKLKNDVFEDYKLAMEETDYGVISKKKLIDFNNDWGKANQDHFKIYTKEEAYAALKLKYAMVVEYSGDEHDETSLRYLGLFFERGWDDEHELQIEIENGRYKQIL